MSVLKFAAFQFHAFNTCIFNEFVGINFYTGLPTKLLWLHSNNYLFFFLTDIFEGIWIFLKLPRTSPMNGDSNSVKKVTSRELPASLVLSAFWDELVLDWLVMGVSLERVDWASSAELNGGKLFGAGGDRWKYRNRKVYNMQQNWSPT